MLVMPNDLIRLMHALFPPMGGAPREPSWQPPLDVYRTRKGWLVKVELAGVRPEDIRINVRGSQITMEGTRRDWFAEEECSCYRMEIAYSHFTRTFELPCDVSQAQIHTDYQYGLLLVHIQTEDLS